MTLVGLQFDIVWENKPANYEKVRLLLKSAPPPPGALVVLPEMFATGFSMEAVKIAELSGGPTGQFLAETAREWKIWIVAGVVRLGASGRGRNEAVVFAPDGLEKARYCKMHTFNPVGEGEHYECGDKPVTFACGQWTVAPVVCYDLRFPEVFRAGARHGAELFVVIANWPTSRLSHWLTLLQARAIENQAYVIGVNRCGSTPKLDYPGRSLIIGPRGEVLADAGNAECAIRADADRESLINYRREFNVLADMRPEATPQTW